MFIMLPCSQRALILVLEHVGNFSVRLLSGLQPLWRQSNLFVRLNVKPLCHRMTGVSKMYAANPG